MLGPYWKYPRLVMRRCRSYMCFTCACRSRRQVQWGINSLELLLRRSWVLSIISAIYQTSSSMEGKMIFASNFSNMIEFYVKYCLRCLWPPSSPAHPTLTCTTLDEVDLCSSEITNQTIFERAVLSGAIILVYLAVADFLHIILGVEQENHGKPKVENESYMYMFDYSSALRVLL